jgi:hypothetical protein
MLSIRHSIDIYFPPFPQHLTLAKPSAQAPFVQLFEIAACLHGTLVNLGLMQLRNLN